VRCFTNGVIRTDKWLDESFNHPEELCSRAKPGIKKDRDFYNYLKYFGMYQPSNVSHKMFKELKEGGFWNTISDFYEKYKKLWKGPEVSIYLFPINGSNRQLMRQTNGKSGVSFEKSIYLFLSPLEDKKEIESLFVHEYHHTARMHDLQKKLLEYTLLDSIVLEGLAEHAVEEYCGEKYLAVWSRGYSDKQLERYWKSDYKSRLTINKKESIHDDLLFGKKFVPNMMGYAMGYKIISEYKKQNSFSTVKTLSIPSESFLVSNFLE
jgi:uncharacterized protein YjaZ